MRGLSRRSLLALGSASLLVAPALVRARSLGSAPRTIVAGAGVFGAWTAERLREAGDKVLLLDAWGAGHSRASSGGESRMTRAAYGPDEIYTRMALDSLLEWQKLSDSAALPLFHRIGVLFFFTRVEPYLTASMEVHRRLGLGTELLDRGAMQARFPMIDFAGVEAGLFEPAFGAIMARRAVQTLVERFVNGGGRYEAAAVVPPDAGNADRLGGVGTLDGRFIEADRFLFACGPWLPKMFPDVLASRIVPTRQEVFFFAPQPGDSRFSPGRLPGWAEFDAGDIFYGFPDLEARGFKIAHDAHGPQMDPDASDRVVSQSGLAKVRAFMKRRFPALAGQPLNEARVCQYENSSNGDLLIDFHPRWRNVLLLGAGSGHGFKHGPAVGQIAANLLTREGLRTDPRFSLSTKSAAQKRAVH